METRIVERGGKFVLEERKGGEWETVGTFNSNVDAEKRDAELKLKEANPDMSRKDVKAQATIDTAAAEARGEAAKDRQQDSGEGS